MATHLRSFKNVACGRRTYEKCMPYLSLHLPSSGLIFSLLTTAEASYMGQGYWWGGRRNDR